MSFTQQEALRAILHEGETYFFLDNVFSSPCPIVYDNKGERKEQFFCINSFVKETTEKKSENIKNIFGFTVEHDFCSLDEQEKIMCIEKPTLVVFSGNKSYHYSFVFDRALNSEEYEKIKEMLKKAFPTSDWSVLSDKTKLVRTPNAIRHDNNRIQSVKMICKKLIVEEFIDKIQQKVSSIKETPTTANRNINVLYKKVIENKEHLEKKEKLFIDAINNLIVCGYSIEKDDIYYNILENFAIKLQLNFEECILIAKSIEPKELKHVSIELPKYDNLIDTCYEVLLDEYGLCESYTDFIRMVFALKSAGIPYEKAQCIFEKNTSYSHKNEKENRYIYEKANPTKIGAGTLYFLAKEANEDGLMKKLSKKCSTCGIEIYFKNKKPYNKNDDMEHCCCMECKTCGKKIFFKEKIPHNVDDQKRHSCKKIDVKEYEYLQEKENAPKKKSSTRRIVEREDTENTCPLSCDIVTKEGEVMFSIIEKKIPYSISSEENMKFFLVTDKGIFLEEVVVNPRDKDDYFQKYTKICSQNVIIFDNATIIANNNKENNNVFVTLRATYPKKIELLVPKSYLHKSNLCKIADMGIDIISESQKRNMSTYFSMYLMYFNNILSRNVYKSLGWNFGDQLFVISGCKEVADRDIHPSVIKEGYTVECCKDDLEKALDTVKNLIYVDKNKSFLINLLYVLLTPALKLMKTKDNASTLENFRFVLFAEGTSGNYKTTLAQYAMSIYGSSKLIRFENGASDNALNTLSTTLNGLPMLVDNYKPNFPNAEKRLISMISQIIEGGMKRKLEITGELKDAPLSFAGLMITGEQFPECDVSIIARVLRYTVEKSDNALDYLNVALKNKDSLRALGKEWIEWLTSEDGRKKAQNIASKFDEINEKWNIITNEMKAQNASRISSNYAIMELAYMLFVSCPTFKKFVDQNFNDTTVAISEDNLKNDLIEFLKKSIKSQSVDSRNASEATQYITAIQEMLASQKVKILGDPSNIGSNMIDNVSKMELPEGDFKTNYIGWYLKKNQVVLLLPHLTMKLVESFYPKDSFNTRIKALGRQLYEQYACLPYSKQIAKNSSALILHKIGGLKEGIQPTRQVFCIKSEYLFGTGEQTDVCLDTEQERE